VVGGKRYLFFVVQQMLVLDEVALAAAYGVPCEVLDEKVMIALQLHKGKEFDPQQVFDTFMKMQKEEGMDPKWMPDFIRIVDSFELTTRHRKFSPAR
jgi:acyl-CoA synthetase (AMP-forming)/AMP-acid ligase II